MKIALSGAGGTGKSTLANELNKRFQIPIIPEYAREIASEMGFGNIRDMTPDKTYEFQCKIIDRKISEEDRNETFIADRSLADNLAYYLRWCSRDLDDSKNKLYVDRCIKRLKNYDHIIVLPQIIPLEDDGFRSSKFYYQYEIHCLILGILSDNKIGYTIITESDLEERIKILRSFYGR